VALEALTGQIPLGIRPDARSSARVIKARIIPVLYYEGKKRRSWSFADRAKLASKAREMGLTRKGRMIPNAVKHETHTHGRYDTTINDTRINDMIRSIGIYGSVGVGN
jgi:hypothetical protein